MHNMLCIWIVKNPAALFGPDRAGKSGLHFGQRRDAAVLAIERPFVADLIGGEGAGAGFAARCPHVAVSAALFRAIDAGGVGDADQARARIVQISNSRA